jgi:hypothetical protein
MGVATPVDNQVKLAVCHLIKSRSTRFLRLAPERLKMGRPPKQRTTFRKEETEIAFEAMIQLLDERGILAKPDLVQRTGALELDQMKRTLKGMQRAFKG